MTRVRSRPFLTVLAGAAVAAAVALPANAAGAAATGSGTSWRVNLSMIQDPSNPNRNLNKPSTRARISQDGKHACFQTPATNAVAGDPGLQDIYWTDFTNPSAPVTRRVSVAWNGTAANKDSTFCELSGTGQKVVFSSLATNLVQGSTKAGIFVRDMVSGVTTFVAKGADRPVIDDAGKYVAYNTLSTTNDVRVTELATGRTLVLTPSAAGSTDESLRPEISGDGTHVVFASDLKLSPSQDTNAERDVYLADITDWKANRSTTFTSRTLVSVGQDGKAVGKGSSRPGINANGSVVSFETFANNVVASPVDTNGQTDAFVRSNGVTRLVSYRKDRTVGNSVSSRPQLDDSGDVVAFVSTGAQIVKGDTNNKEDAFIRNWKKELSEGPASVHTYLLAAGPAPNGDPGVCPGIANADEGTKAISTRPYLSGNGRSAVFVTGDCNLAADAAHGGPDTNLFADIYFRSYPSAI